MSEIAARLREQKLKIFLKFRPLFGLIPFLDFVILSGSLVFGKIHDNSDFDVIVGARKGRIFTVRFFCFLIFSAFGIRRKKDDSGEALKDKICFNHFVTEASYRLKPPYNAYWENLYQNLLPVFGRKEVLQKFFRANDFLIKDKEISFKYLKGRGSNLFRFIVELIFDGWFGDFLEKVFKNLQVKRIKKTLKEKGIGFEPRLRFNDEELEFHPDNVKYKEYYL
jgi:hypothetical protein